MTKKEARKTGRQGDRETRRQGDKGIRGTLCLLSFCLIVPLSPLPLVSLPTCRLVRPSLSQTDMSLTSAQLRGRQIYRKGGDGIQVALGDDDFELPGSTFPCGNCHGIAGLGGKEGGLQPPPIAWDLLNLPRTSTFSGQIRPGYDEGALKRALA